MRSFLPDVGFRSRTTGSSWSADSWMLLSLFLADVVEFLLVASSQQYLALETLSLGPFVHAVFGSSMYAAENSCSIYSTFCAAFAAEFLQQLQHPKIAKTDRERLQDSGRSPLSGSRSLLLGSGGKYFFYY